MIKHGTKLETIIDMLNRATPLYISGIAAAIGFKMNLFNIGVEGQYLMGAFFAAAAGGAIDLPPGIHVLFILLVAMTVGALVGRARRTAEDHTRDQRGDLDDHAQLRSRRAASSPGCRWRGARAGCRPTPARRTIANSGHIFNLTRIVEIFTRDIGGGRAAERRVPDRGHRRRSGTTCWSTARASASTCGRAATTRSPPASVVCPRSG